MLQRAEKLGLMATDADVESRFAELKAPYTQEEFQRQLAARKMSVDDMKAQLKRDLSVTKLFNKEITSHISISDKDVTDFYNANKSSFNFPGAASAPGADPGDADARPERAESASNDKAQNDDQARKKIDMLAGADAAEARTSPRWRRISPRTPTSAPNGGDLGFVPDSALDKANPEIRKAIQAAAPGQITPVVKTPEGYRIFKIYSKEPAGQRELTDPRVQQNIRETLLNRKDQLAARSVLRSRAR